MTSDRQAKTYFRGARYLLRFDDICPTMNWAVWAKIEALLDQFGVRPLLAVVPDNRDPVLQVADAADDFWDKVRNWQAKGWTIGLHGYQHCYETVDPGVIGINPRSEFAGLSKLEQQRKICGGLEIFKKHGIKPDLWIAPAHSFDATTVQVLNAQGINAISDGFHLFPFTDNEGVTWFPQQLWGFRRFPAGIWTICFHHNSWSDAQLKAFAADLNVYRSKITDIHTVSSEFAWRRGRLSPVQNKLALVLLNLKRRLRIRHRLRRLGLP